MADRHELDALVTEGIRCLKLAFTMCKALREEDADALTLDGDSDMPVDLTQEELTNHVDGVYIYAGYAGILQAVLEVLSIFEHEYLGEVDEYAES